MIYLNNNNKQVKSHNSLFIAVATKELDEGSRLHSLPNILKDNGFVIDKQKKEEILPLWKKEKFR